MADEETHVVVVPKSWAKYWGAGVALLAYVSIKFGVLPASQAAEFKTTAAQFWEVFSNLIGLLGFILPGLWRVVKPHRTEKVVAVVKLVLFAFLLVGSSQMLTACCTAKADPPTKPYSGGIFTAIVGADPRVKGVPANPPVVGVKSANPFSIE